MDIDYNLLNLETHEYDMKFEKIARENNPEIYLI